VNPGFDHVIHAPIRLQICSMLSAIDDAEFAALRDSIGVSDSVLSKHLRVLEEVGYLTLRKSSSGGRTHTWARLTRAGRTAFAGHVAELQRLADGLRPRNVLGS
jgi:DNA-binding transcriptional ArsR family regulator